ncbi:arsenic metallochaperone ArsD family protein [Kocuria massiliensis]|uniref:arsenic metallochaperone ArsD family protein n=1 Tax=Kocuria massiliensis TaxID=1926282 RepID=UPI000A1C851A|nr:arsenic metallochaperone ArsD family protein [Kocuria massiliensis]
MSDLTEVEVFIPAGGPDDVEREAFLDAAASLAEQGYPITVYVRGEDEWAFEQCEHVADMIAASGDMVLPITLLGPQIVVSWMYPTAEQMQRFATAREPKRKDPRFSAAASACGPGGRSLPGQAGAPADQPAPAGFAAVLAGVQEKPRGGPDIGSRRNLMGGDVGDGLPEGDSSTSGTPSGGCCGGSCGCGGH